MQESQPSLISEEQKKIQKDMEIVQATEGFSRLTEKQKSIIKQSLYLQARAERGRKEWKLGDVRKYKNSEDYVDNRNCHSAVFCLETENMQALSKDAKADSDFFEAEYRPAKKIDELKKQIEEFGFPCALHISILRNSSPNKVHSSLVLGHDKKNNIVLWEKKSYDVENPYQIVTLDEMYIEYGSEYFYGLRKLRDRVKDLPKSNVA